MRSSGYGALGPGRLTAPPGLGLGMAQPRPPAPQGRPRRGSLPAGAGWQVRTMAGAAWPTGVPRATTQSHYPESSRLCQRPITVSVCIVGLIPGLHGAPQFHGQFFTVPVGQTWGHWVCGDTGCVCNCCWDGATCCLRYPNGTLMSEGDFGGSSQVGCPASGHTTPSLPLPCVRASAVACGAVTVGVTCCCVCTLWVTVPCVRVYMVALLVQQCVVVHCDWLCSHLQWASSLPQPIAGSI